jgi:hypothetical protein
MIFPTGGYMNKKRILGVILIFIIIAFVFIQPAYMGPGSKIAKMLIENFWGKLIFGLLGLGCLSLSIYIFAREKIFD